MRFRPPRRGCTCPAAPPYPVVVFFHGGGWSLCSLATHDHSALAICRDADAVVVSVDDRMAPDHSFPTAKHDCFAATRWVAENASPLGGDRAGGNLGAVVTQMARDAGSSAIRFAALITPAVDISAKGGSLDEHAPGYSARPASLRMPAGGKKRISGANIERLIARHRGAQ
jgi:acetyl esterase